MIPVQFCEKLVTEQHLKPACAQLITTLLHVMYNMQMAGHSVEDSAARAVSPYLTSNEAELARSVVTYLVTLKQNLTIQPNVGENEQFKHDAMSLNWAEILPEAVQSSPDHHHLIAA